jgi:diaminohydroxyphosphoribosylaminopyrimidine deaminase/5-amino-6-(5-phosphoribosylamino)uracil reductase
MTGAGDARYMDLALEAARRGWGQTAPNPMVGAVVVQGDRVVGTGWHAKYGEAHAEVMALERAGDAALGATMYVTLEPCAHHGKTPPCAAAIVHAGITRVVLATRDPNPKAAGGVERLRAAGIQVDIGPGARASCELNAPFFNSFVSDRPWVTLKLALSADGAMAGADGSSKWITGWAARAEVHRMRADSDAVAVGIGTVLADDPLLTAREGPPPRCPPARVVFDRQARLPLVSALVGSVRMAPVLVVADSPPAARRDALERAGVEVLLASSLEASLQTLRGRGIRSLLVEGGAKIAAALLEGALVDRLVIFQAPTELGAGALRPFASLPASKAPDAANYRVVERSTLNADTKTVFAVKELPCSPD